MYLISRLFASKYFVLLCVRCGLAAGGGYLFAYKVEVVDAYDFTILSPQAAACSPQSAASGW
jgi:hypothetical protein